MAAEEQSVFPMPESARPAAVPDLAQLMPLVARGDERAFEQVYDLVSDSVYGLVRRVLRDPAQSAEVTQEVLVEVWRGAARFDPGRGSPQAWIMTLAHRRAVDRVRSAQAAAEREWRAAASSGTRPHDEVAEQVADRLEQERVRRCLDSLTDVQRDSIRLAYYGGYTYPQVAELLAVPLGTVKTRIRDGLIRLRDCLGVG